MSAVDGMIRVFLLDDHAMVRRGVADRLDAEPDLRVVGGAGTAAQALARVPAAGPDVAVLDVRLPDGDGVTVCRELRSAMPALRCLLLTTSDDDEALLSAVLAGASGYVLKQIRGSGLVGAVRTVAAGGSLLDAHATAHVLRRLHAAAERRGALPGFTDRERAVLDLVGAGLTDRQIGERMHLPAEAVRNHVSDLLAELGTQRRTRAAVLATEPRRPPAGVLTIEE